MKYARQFDLVITNPLDGSTKYLEEVLDAAHDFYFQITRSYLVKKMKA